MINKIFGESFKDNAFFRKVDMAFIIHLLKSIKLEHVAEGEFIYHVNHASNESSRL